MKPNTRKKFESMDLKLPKKGMKMKHTWITVARRAGASTLFAMAATVNADNWCPTSTDYTISCSNCTKTLTCSRYYGPILITGSNVTLDGNGYGVYFSSGNGVRITGANASISNLTLWESAQLGIAFAHTAYNDYGNVNNVNSNNSGSWGLTNWTSRTSLSVSNSYFYGNNCGVFQNAGTNQTYIDMVSNVAAFNDYDGYYSGNGATQYIWGNQLSDNGGSGAEDNSQINGGSYVNNGINHNGDYGLKVINNGDYTLSLVENWASSNGVDCHGYGAQALYVSGNSFDTNQGCVTKP